MNTNVKPDDPLTNPPAMAASPQGWPPKTAQPEEVVDAGTTDDGSGSDAATPEDDRRDGGAGDAESGPGGTEPRGASGGTAGPEGDQPPAEPASPAADDASDSVAEESTA